jgi:hypothetical protein
MRQSLGQCFGLTTLRVRTPEVEAFSVDEPR